MESPSLEIFKTCLTTALGCCTALPILHPLTHMYLLQDFCRIQILAPLFFFFFFLQGSSYVGQLLFYPCPYTDQITHLFPNIVCGCCCCIYKCNFLFSHCLTCYLVSILSFWGFGCLFRDVFLVCTVQAHAVVKKMQG